VKGEKVSKVLWNNYQIRVLEDAQIKGLYDTEQSSSKGRKIEGRWKNKHMTTGERTADH